MSPPDLSDRRKEHLTIITDTLAQSGLPVFSHLLARPSKRRRVVYCLENDPDLLLNDSSDAIEVVDCWSVTDFDDLTPDLHAKSAKRICIAAERLNGTETNVTDANVFLDSLDALVQATSTTAALSLLRQFLNVAAHLTVLLHADSAVPQTWALTPQLNASMLHLEVHPAAVAAHLQRGYGVSIHSTRAPDLLHRLHVRSWAGAGFDYADEGSRDEAATSWNGLSSARIGEALIRWTKRTTGGSKVDRGVCTVRLGDGQLDWESSKEVEMAPVVVMTENGFDLPRTAEQQLAKDGLRLPFAPEHGGAGPAVIYNADSGDDFDEDEPDEDLAI